MNGFNNLSYYEILEVPTNASAFEIRQAYKDCLSIYDEDSLTTYMFFDFEERKRILEKIEEAFYTLIDDQKREAYDNMLVKSGQVPSDRLLKRETKKPIPLFQIRDSSESNVSRSGIKDPFEREGFKALCDETFSKEIITGSDLKTLRETAGIKLEEIFESTRITLKTLEAIEGTDIENLPPTIYLRNFLRMYAANLQVEPGPLVSKYLKGIDIG